MFLRDNGSYHDRSGEVNTTTTPRNPNSDVEWFSRPGNSSSCSQASSAPPKQTRTFGNSQKDHGMLVHFQRANTAPPLSITHAASAKPGSAAHHDLFSKSKQRSSWQRFQTANIAPPLNFTDPYRRASCHSFEETVQYSSTAGHRFAPTVVQMSCNTLYLCRARSRGDGSE